MIKPQTLYNFGKVCRSDVRAGRVLRALCDQDVPLDDADREWVDAIRNDNEWFNERIDERRRKDRKRQKEWRESHGLSRAVTVTERDSALSRAIPPSLPSSLPSSEPPSEKEDTNRSVSVPLGGGERNGTETERDFKAIGEKEAKKAAEGFRKALSSDPGAFFDPAFDPALVCATVTGDFRSVRRWRQLAKAKGECGVREEAFAFWREIQAGEDVANRGAALNERLGRLPDERQGGATA